MSDIPIEKYRARLKRGELHHDAEQEKAVQALQRLYDELMEAHEAAPANLFQRITGLGQMKQAAPLGVYMYGGVGRGKSMLMDLFYSCLPDDIRKTRVHFHKFMIDVHDYIHSRRESDGIREGVDATLPLLAERLAERSRVICFDEFHVTDVADAMILGRLFTALFDRGVVVVATSNWEPDRLYEGGLQRDRFLPFIALLKNKLEIVHLDSPTDYRTQVLAQEGVYFSPLGGKTKARVNEVFHHLTDGAEVHAEDIDVKGRVIKVAQVANGAARFGFAQLCEQPLGAEDYLALTQRYRIIFLEGIPRLGYDRRNEAKRLMTLIDVLYDASVHVVFQADATPENLYNGHDHSFEFERTISRINEMQSKEYVQRNI
ncbi:MAG: cell division protein ZapE [Micavibrio sp.]|nr:cell division protein ZapE [Micavibrio sp.]|tara:strand:- start:211 stop:1332 length:1122 start_codon:yes stop_codon:yes gene_type:complete